jgi:hypothetical protein
LVIAPPNFSDQAPERSLERVATGTHQLLVAVREPEIAELGGKGSVTTAGGGLPFAFVDGHWFQNQLQSIIGSMQADPRSLVMFLTPDIGLLLPHGVRCFSGFHMGALGYMAVRSNGNGHEPVQT